MHSHGFIIIPVKNEADNLLFVLQELLSYDFVPIKNIILVNNGSTDLSESIARSLGVSVVNEPILGYGRACLSGIKYIQTLMIPEWIIIMDGDGSDDPLDIHNLLSEFYHKKGDLVIGSRILGNAEKNSLGIVQKFGNKFLCSLLSSYYKLQFTDLGPLRVIRFTTLLQLDLSDPTWGWNIEMQIRAIQINAKIIEVPVNYRKRKSGVSKISGSILMIIRVSFKIIYTFIKLTFFNRKNL
jgi:glycosyltransferase involved in cell wall biosynthesis